MEEMMLPEPTWVYATVVVLYCSLAFFGWAVTFVGHLNYRFYPMMAQLGAAVGLLPSFQAFIWARRLLGNPVSPEDPWLPWSLLVIVGTTVVFCILAIITGIRACRKELREGKKLPVFPFRVAL